MKNGRQIMTVVYIPFANLPVLLFCYHNKAMSCPDKLSPLFYLPDASDLCFYIFQHFPHYLFILIGKEHNHLVGKQGRILKKQKVQFPIRAQNI